MVVNVKLGLKWNVLDFQSMKSDQIPQKNNNDEKKKKDISSLSRGILHFVWLDTINNFVLLGITYCISMID